MRPSRAAIAGAFVGSLAYAQPVPPAAPPPPDPTVSTPAADAPVPEPPAAPAGRPKTSGWKDGFFVEAEDGQNRLRIGGVIQFDGRFFVDDARDPHVDQFTFRSIRSYIEGTLWEHYDFRLLPDFAGSKLVIQEAWTDIHYSDAVKVRFGKFKVPFGLERLQSEIHTMFVERGLPSQVAPNRDLGVQVSGELAGSIVAYQLGAFNGVADGQSGDGDVSDEKEVAARIFVKPFATGGPLVKQLGVGVAATYGTKTGTLASPDVALFKTQGQTTFFAYQAGTTAADTVLADGPHWRATAQGHYYAGPIGVVAEYIRSKQKVALDGTHRWVSIDTWQVVGQWVIAGGEASYRSVVPTRPFDPGRGQWGAFDVAARLGELQMAGADIYPGGFADPAKSARKAWSAGGGADWFCNQNFRFMLDVEHTWYARGASGGADKPAETSIVGRVQTAF
jgi:phosphate-selective porin OprO and OprP